MKTVRKMFAGLLACGACAAACAGTVRTVTAPALTLDTRIELVKAVEDAATLRLSTRWDDVPEGVLTVNGAAAARLGATEEADHVLDGLAPGEYVCSWTTGTSTNLATFCVRGGVSALPPDGAGVRTATAPALTLDTRIGLMKVVEDATTLRLSTRWDGAEAGTLTVNGVEAARLGADAEADHVLSGLAPGEYVCSWTTGASTNLATFCVRGGVSALPPDGTGVRTATVAPITLDTRIGLMKVVEDTATLRLSTRWDGVPEGVLTVNGTAAARLGADAEADHVLAGLAPGEYVCQWTTGASTNLATFCVRGGASALPPDGAGVRTATVAPVALDTRIGLVKEVADAATLRLSTRWDGVPEGVLTVNGAEAARLGADAEADHVLSGLAPGEYVCRWTTGASTNLATFCVRGGASALPPDGAGVRTTTAAAITLDTRIGLVKVVEDAATLRLSTRWDGAEAGMLTVNGAEVVWLGAAEEADHVLFGLAPGEYVCSWTTGASTNLATFCVRGGSSALPPDGAGVRTATAAAITLDTRIGLYKVLPVSDRGVASAVCRLSTRWDGAEAGTLTVNGEEVRALGSSEEADHRLDGLAPGEYVCRWTAGDATYLATFSVRGDGTVRPPRTGVEVTITGHTATYAYDGREKRAGGFDVATSDPLYTAADFVFTGNSNAVRTAVGTTPFGMSAADFANVNPDFADVVFHVVDGSVTVTPCAVVNPFDPDDPSAPPSPGALARADCTAVYDGEGHSVSVAPLLNPALAADGATVAYSPDPSRVPFAPESPVFTNAVSTSVWYRVASPNYAPFTTNALLEIRPRPVAFASKSAAKAYDGTPLTAHEVAVGGDGFVDGEGATYTFTGSQTAVGTSENIFTYTLNENTVAGNYVITTVNGTLTVTKASVGGGEGGGDEPGSGNVPDGGLSKFDAAFVYDGAGHTIDTNALVTAFGAAMDGESAVEYAAGGSQFTATVSDAMNCVPPCFTNAGEYVIWYRVTNPNYEDFVHTAKVTITKRPVTLTSGTKTDFVYDGQPHACPHFIKSGHGFVEGEGIIASNWATVTTVAQGEVANTFDYAPLDGTDLGNYELTVVTGRISVVAAPIPVGPGGVVMAVGYTNVYDGAAHGVAVSVAGLLTAPTVQYRASEVDAWTDVSPMFGGVCDTQVWYRVSAPNYAPVVGSVGVKITPRPITLTAPTKSKTYDGTPLTFDAGDVVVGGDGYAPGEAFALSGFASITEAGRIDAGYTVADGTARMDNYAITRVVGMLAVTPRPVTLTSKSDTKVYDGTPLRCDAVHVKDGSLNFVDDEGFVATCSGALTDVGAVENRFDYALTGGALAGNYTITKEYGWLRVTPATLDPGAVFGDGETDADGGPLCARVYNGAPQPFALALDFGEPYRLLYALVPDDEGAYSETAPTRTYVAEGDLTVYFKFQSPNYAPYYGRGTLRIVPKALTEEMCVADEDAAWFFDGTEKKPAVTVVDGDPNIATADDYTLAYSGRTGAGLFPVTVTGRNNYTGTVTKAFAILKRPVAPPVIPSRAYNGRLQKPTITADARWTVVANPGGTDAGLYANVVLRLTNTADYKWKGFDEDVPDWTGVFEIRKGANGWSTYPGIRSWTNGVEAASEPTGRARFGTLSVAYRRRGAPVASETAVRPSAPGRYTARFWVEETKNYAGCGLVTPYEVDFEIFRGPDDPIGGSYTTTTPVPVPYAWLDAYVDRFGGGDYEAAAHATGVNGVTLWESYVAGLDPTNAASRFTASITVGADGMPRITWSPDLREAEPPRAYTVHGKPDLGAAAWVPVTDANRATLRFFKVTVELQEENR